MWTLNWQSKNGNPNPKIETALMEVEEYSVESKRSINYFGVLSITGKILVDMTYGAFSFIDYTACLRSSKRILVATRFYVMPGS